MQKIPLCLENETQIINYTYYTYNNTYNIYNFIILPISLNRNRKTARWTTVICAVRSAWRRWPKAPEKKRLRPRRSPLNRLMRLLNQQMRPLNPLTRPLNPLNKPPNRPKSLRQSQAVVDYETAEV